MTTNEYVKEKVRCIEGALTDVKQRITDSEKMKTYVADISKDDTSGHIQDLEYIQRQITLAISKLRGDENHEDPVNDFVQEIKAKTEKSLLKR